MEYMTEILLILAALIWGSFTNALIYRLPLKISLSDPKRSQCPNCKTEIAWNDNLPVLSWLLLKGKCRNCKTNISVIYPFVEIVNSILAVVSYQHFGPNLTAVLAFFLLSTLVVITIIDLQHMIIPDKINKPGMIFGLILGGLNEWLKFADFPFSLSLIESFSGLCFGYGLLYGIAWIYFKISGVSGLGGGDIKLMGFMGALLGPACVLPILISSSLSGAVIGLTVMLINRSGLKTEIPFGPWIALGICLYLFGFNVIDVVNYYTTQLLQTYFFPI